VAVAQQPLAIEKLLDRYTIGPPEFDPSGTRVVFAVTEPVKGSARNVHLWQYRPATRELRQLTFSSKSEVVPRWSPDGSQLAFQSTRDDGNQIYLLPMSGGGGEAQPLTKGKASVRSHAWSPEGRRIAYLASRPKSEEREKREKDKDDARVVDRDVEPPQLWIVDVPGGTPRSVAVGGDWTVHQFVWARNGNAFYALATTRPHSDRWEDSIIEIPVSGGQVREIAKLKGPAGSLDIAPGGRLLSYFCARVDGPDAHDLCVIDPATGVSRNITRMSVDRPVMSARWQSDETLLATFQDGFLNAPMLVAAADGSAQPAAAKGMWQSYVKHQRTGAVASVRGSSTEPTEFWFGNDKVTDLHKGWPATAKVETFRYKSFDGTMIEGGLLKPANGSGPMPLAVLVHGGPTGRWTDSLEPWGQLLVSRGIAVFYPNPRGSTGYGFDFVAANRADWGFGDFKDIMAGVDDLVIRKIADPAKLGIGGWSYGGYMSMWAVTQTNRFQCSVAGAGLSDLASEFGTEGNSAYDEWFFGTPYENLEKFQRSSPITYIRNARTPTLILQGENDDVDPIGQSQQFYRALKLLNVPSELVLYPREGHGIREAKHMLDLYRRVVAWFEKYLGGTATAKAAP